MEKSLLLTHVMVGVIDGRSVGTILGELDGPELGDTLGANDGAELGRSDGVTEGEYETLGETLGITDMYDLH